ncbi:MAG: [FeFe] hydrogenase H-cluster radical SAM maturase HydG [Candidatus Omnitrophota bacterium]
MKRIDQASIERCLAEGRSKASSVRVCEILGKASAFERLTLEEVSVLIGADDAVSIEKILICAAEVKNRIYGTRVVLFAPLYISNICQNRCLYCAFKDDNGMIARKKLSMDEIKEQTRRLLQKGHKRILMVSGEAASKDDSTIDFYIDAIKAIYSVSVGPHRIKRVNVNCAPLSVEQFKRLKAAGIGTYQLFQETYHEATYRQVHPQGPKSDPDNRLDAVDRAFEAGIDDVGIGALYGLYNWRFETLALLSHVEHLEHKFSIGPHTISVPRLEKADGAPLSSAAPHPVSDADFKRLVAILRLAVPYTGIILSTRESAALRDELFGLGISQVSAESETSPGGYGEQSGGSAQSQFHVSDRRSLDEVMASLIQKGIMPSFCAACYRKGRTGKAFMDLAKPGTIKGKCDMNAIITLKEYLDDFASGDVKAAGYALIRGKMDQLDADSKSRLQAFFKDIANGARDAYV